VISPLGRHTSGAVRIVVAVACACVVAGLGPAEAATNAKPPFVGPVAYNPFTVHGVRFRPSELVTVRVDVRGEPRVTKTIRAGAAGTFRVRFPRLRIDECTAYTIQATGARGSRARYTEPPPLCGPYP
jgi:hypothetical protein